MNAALSPTTFYELAKSASGGTAATAFPLLVDDDYPVTSSEVAAGENNLYWATSNMNGTPIVVSRKRQKGAPPITLLRGAADGAFGSIAIDATHVYVIDSKGGAVIRVPKAGTSAGEVFMDGLVGPLSLVVDGTAVYATVEATGATGAVVKRKK